MDFKCDELILGKTDADSRALTTSEHLACSRLSLESHLTNRLWLAKYQVTNNLLVMIGLKDRCRIFQPITGSEGVRNEKAR